MVLGQLKRRAGEVVLFIDEIHTVVSAYGLADGAPRWLELPAWGHRHIKAQAARTNPRARPEKLGSVWWWLQQLA